MSLETIFFFELMLAALVLIGTMVGVVYIGLHDRRIRRQTGRLVGTADIAVGLTPDELARGVTESPAPRRPPRRDFYERIELPKGAELKPPDATDICGRAQSLQESHRCSQSRYVGGRMA